jgi:bacterial/archaeal transporter family protein
MWLLIAILSAFFAGLTSILAKSGIRKTDSDLATGLRTIVGSAKGISTISARSLLFLILSGIATGASWICYFKALSMGDVNKVVPVDKSSTVMTILLAIIIFRETNNLPVKLLSAALLGVGVWLMIEKKKADQTKQDRAWIIYAALGAVFAALTAILAKVGIENVESNLGTAIRTGVVLMMAWAIILSKGKQKQIRNIDRKELLFISLSGVATGASWLCYYYALQKGIVSVVVPIDKMSILVSIAFSYFVFKERLSRRAMFGLLLMVAGTLLMVFTG